MYKILIVDDEELVRKAIVSKLDWASIGFDEVEQAEDGEQALEIALRFKPHVVLTDIRMPFMDGLELAERLKAELPDTKVVVLSGHDEFEYAQEAIKIGVLDYILKPIRSAKLAELMEKLKVNLDDEYNERAKLLKLKNQLHQSLPLLREKFLNSLINNSISEREIEKKLDYLEISFAGKAFIVCVSEIDNLNVLAETSSAEDIELLIFSVLNIVSELTGSRGMAFQDFYNRQIIVFNLPSENIAASEIGLYSILESIKENIEKYLKITVTIGIGREVSKLEDLHISYKDALHALEYKIALGKNKVYDINDLGYRQSDIFYPLDRINGLLSKIKLEGPEEVRSSTEEFFDDMIARKNISADNIKIILSELVNGAQRILAEVRDESGDTGSLDFGIYGKIEKYETLEDIKIVIIRFLTDISKFIRTVRNSRNRQIINKARQIIDENYRREELSLNYVAGMVSVSPGYLSILFRRETNETFIEYLTSVRMEKAKELLKTSNLKAYEVAYNVGFNDPHYFSMCFKKYTGVTPSDYKAGS